MGAVNPARAGMIHRDGGPRGEARRKPRASGDDPRAGDAMGHAPAVNPARAGMIRPADRPSPAGPCKPRASGDDPGLAVFYFDAD